MLQKPENTETLKVLLDALVDPTENYSKYNRSELLEKANMMASSILAGTTTRADVSKKWIKAAGAVVGAGVLMEPLGIAAVNVWLAMALLGNFCCFENALLWRNSFVRIYDIGDRPAPIKLSL